jgi:hypothetical protein
MGAHLRHAGWRWTRNPMVWYYFFDLPVTREERVRIQESGFATKGEAQDAEKIRRTEEKQKRELAKAGASVAAPLPKALSMLLEEFFRQHVDEKLTPKTIERYHEQAGCNRGLCCRSTAGTVRTTGLAFVTSNIGLAAGAMPFRQPQ